MFVTLGCLPSRCSRVAVWWCVWCGADKGINKGLQDGSLKPYAGPTFKLAEAPAGMKIGAQTGAIRWEPKPDQIGSYTVAIVVDDLEGGQTQQVFELSTTAPDAPPAKPASSE